MFRSDQGGVADGRPDPLSGPGALPAEVAACHGPWLQLRHLSGGRAGL